MRLARTIVARLRGRSGSPPGPLLFLPCVLALLGGLSGCVEDPTAAEPECGQEPVLEPGARMVGSLDSNDPRFEDARIDYYSVVLEDSTLVFLRLSSTEFDPFIYLFDASNTVAAQSYNPQGEPAGASESAILARNLAPGCHLVGATAWDPDGTGEYTFLLNIPEPLVQGAPADSR